MPDQLKALAFIASLCVGPQLLVTTAPAQADERCSGTLCDLYYGKSSDDQVKPAKPAAPTPIVVPKNGILGYFSNGGAAQKTAPADASGTPAAGSTSRMHLGGGGLLGMARGETPERCSGTLCDLYYGGPPPEKPEAAAGAAAATSQPASDAAQPAAEEIADAAPPSRRERVEFAAPEPKPRCAPTVQDPWRCYR